MNAITSILVLAALIFIHELGHFLFAKLFRVGVIEFAIGFGKKVWSRVHGETEYAIRLIPLGGFVRMVGDDPRALEHEAELSERERELLKDKDRWFLNKGFWPKFLIVFAGPLFNLVFAVLLAFVALTVYGVNVPENKTIIGAVMPGQPAARAGLREGDKVLAINGASVETWTQLAETVTNSGGAELELTVERAGAGGGAVPDNTNSDSVNSDSANSNSVNSVSGDSDGASRDAVTQLKLLVTPVSDLNEIDIIEGREPGRRFRIGIVPGTRSEPVTIAQAAVGSVLQVYHMVDITVRSLWGMVSGLISTKNIGGPIMIFQEAARSASRGFEAIINFMILVSVSLGVLNLLPIPILDGGHIVFFIIEKIKGSPVSQRVYEVANQVGMLALGLLMVFALGNDISRFFQ